MRPDLQVLRWTLLGPLIGTVLMSPLIWFLGSPFDRGSRSFELLLYTLPIAYVIGALATPLVPMPTRPSA